MKKSHQDSRHALLRIISIFMRVSPLVVIICQNVSVYNYKGHLYYYYVLKMALGLPALRLYVMLQKEFVQRCANLPVPQNLSMCLKDLESK